MMSLLFHLFGILLTNLIVCAVNFPSCNYLTTNFGFQAIDICTVGGNGGVADMMYTCYGGQVLQNSYALNSGCTGSYSTLNVFTSGFDCSQSTCTDYAVFAYYYNASDCSIYSHQTLISPNNDLCFFGGGAYETYEIYNDSTADPPFNMQAFHFTDADCTQYERCYTLSDIPSANIACGAVHLLSYTGTPITTKTCNVDGGGSNVTTAPPAAADIPQCNYVITNLGYQAIGVCLPGGNGGVTDIMFTCASNGAQVLQNQYALNSGCNGAALSTLTTFSDASTFDCSRNQTCSDYAVFPWYWDANNCAMYSHQTLLPNLCLQIGGDGYDTYEVYNDSSLDPPFNVQVCVYSDRGCTQYSRHYTLSEAPSQNIACGEPPLLSYTGTAASERTPCFQPTTAYTTTAVPETTAIPTSAIPTSGMPTTAAPTTAIPTAYASTTAVSPNASTAEPVATDANKAQTMLPYTYTYTLLMVIVFASCV